MPPTIIVDEETGGGTAPPTPTPTSSTANTSPSGKALLTPTHRGLSAVSRLYDVDGDGILSEAEAALRSLDASGRGHLSNAQAVQIIEDQLALQRQMFNMKRLVVGLVAFTVMLALSNLGTAFAAARMAQDTAVRPPSSSSPMGGSGDDAGISTVATLTDREGHDLATIHKGISIEATTTEGIPYVANDGGNGGGDGGDAQRRLVEEYVGGGGGDNLRGSDAVYVDGGGTGSISAEANRLNDSGSAGTDGGNGGNNATSVASNEDGTAPPASGAAGGPVIADPDDAGAAVAQAGLTFRTNLIGPEQAEEIFQACRFSTPTTVTHFCLGQPTITRIGCSGAQKIGGWLTSDADGDGDGEPAPYTYTFDRGVKILCGLYSDNSRAADAMGGCNILGLPCFFNRNDPKPACGDGRPSLNATENVRPQNQCTASCECASDCCIGFTTPVCMEEAPNEFTSCII